MTEAAWFLPLLAGAFTLFIAGFGWSVYAVLYGQRARIKRRLSAFAVDLAKDQTPKRKMLI